jgi:FAD-linked oxidoreductase
MSTHAREISSSTSTWQNWSGGQKAQPAHIFYPENEQVLTEYIRKTQGAIRVVGGGHSFSPLVPTNGTLISLEEIAGLVNHDAAALTATFHAGTHIYAMGPALRAIGQGLANEGDINLQSLAGVVSTATHGTGRQLQCYSAMTTALRVVLADGSTVQCSAEKEPELFAAARVALGGIGVLSQITLQNRAAYRLREEINVQPINEVLTTIHNERDQHRHIEFFAFPYGKKAIIKRLNLTEEESTPPLKPLIDENALLEFAADTARKYPKANPWIQKLIGVFVSNTVRVGNSSDIFPAPRTVAFNEMEYSLPADRGIECFQEILATMQKANINVFFPIEFRYVAADDCWLSPFYERASVAISVHQYYKQDYHEFFKLVEPIFWKYQGRPHWGKLHTLTAPKLRELYPRFDDFLKVRQQVDPQGRFLNDHLKKIFLG